MCVLATALTLAGVAARTDAAQFWSPSVTAGEDPVRELRARIEALRADETIDPSIREQMLAILAEAEVSLKEAEASAAREADQRRQAQEAPTVLAAIRQELAEPSVEPQIEVPPGATVSQIEQIVAQVSADLTAAQQQAESMAAEPDRRSARQAEIAAELASLKQRVSELETERATMGSEEGAEPLDRARRLRLESQLRAAAAEIAALEAESASYEARRELPPVRRDLARKKASELDGLLKAWQAELARAREAEARRVREETERLQREAARQHPILAEFAEATSELVERNQRVSVTETGGRPSRIQEVRNDIESRQATLAQVREQYRRVSRQIELIGLNRSTGLLLRRHYEELPDEGSLRRAAERSHQSAAEASYERSLLQEERDDAWDVEQAAGELLAQIDQAAIDSSGGMMEWVARELAESRRSALDSLIESYDRYTEALLQQESVSLELATASKSFREYIEVRILWSRSVTSGRLLSMDQHRDALQWLLDVSAWRSGLENLFNEALSRWARPLAALAALVLTIVLHRRSLSRLEDLATLVRRYKTDRFRHTLEAVILTVVAALPLPLALWLAGWLLSRPADQPEVVIASAAGLTAVSYSLLPLFLLQQVLRRYGLAASHFKWNEEAAGLVRRHLRWFLPVFGVCLLAALTLEGQSDDIRKDSFGRAMFIVAMATLALFNARVLAPRGALMSSYVADHPEGWISRLQRVWFVLAVGLPLGLLTAAAAGYYYTAMQLERRLEVTLAVILGIVVINAVAERWLLVARRRLIVEEARRKRDQQAEDAASAKPVDGGEAPAFEEDQVDIPAIDAQTRQLFQTVFTIIAVVGLYLVWANVLPALRMLDRVQIWPSLEVKEIVPTEDLPGLTTPSRPAPVQPQTSGAGAGGAPSDARPAGNGSGSIAESLPISGGGASSSGTQGASVDGAAAAEPPPTLTLADVALAIVLLLLTVAATRNLPGMAEIVLLQRLPLDAGSRFAIKTVIRYAIIFIGVVATFAAIGIGWSNVQWLAAALTFGLAFGLQEIFANFVSGLIILAERPMRVGDVVTVGTTSGTVTKIRMRATTITDFERKELIIPNKSFITDQLVNWTLSDQILRVTIPVGISYSGDYEKAEEILLDIAAKMEHVLADPTPRALFLGFGDSTLNFELRVFIPNLDHWLQVRHNVHKEIFRRFKEAGIEIAFPQRDLHIRSAPGLEDALREAARERRGKGADES